MAQWLSRLGWLGSKARGTEFLSSALGRWCAECLVFSRPKVHAARYASQPVRAADLHRVRGHGLSTKTALKSLPGLHPGHFER